MIKHIGRHGDKKIVIMYKTVPDEEHMCLVCYSDLLPRTYHDAVMSVLESDAGQQAKEFAEALFRNLLPDGRNILTSLHKEGLIKKIQTDQVIVTPDMKNNVRLDELNKILKQMEAGAEAVKRMSEIDKQTVQANALNAKKPKHQIEKVAEVLTESNISQNLIEQATRMKNEANVLLAEAKRLEIEAGVNIKVKKPRGRPKVSE
jgi:hypothetical protein